MHDCSLGVDPQEPYQLWPWGEGDTCTVVQVAITAPGHLHPLIPSPSSHLLLSLSSSSPSPVARYDLNPITVRYHEDRPPLYHFLTTVCAIVGGTFTVAGLNPHNLIVSHVDCKKVLSIRISFSHIVCLQVFLLC